MTADEIRHAYTSTTPCFDPADVNSVRLAAMEVNAEIAAQLAELNSNLDSIANSLNFIAKK